MPFLRLLTTVSQTYHNPVEKSIVDQKGTNVSHYQSYISVKFPSLSPLVEQLLIRMVLRIETLSNRLVHVAMIDIKCGLQIAQIYSDFLADYGKFICVSYGNIFRVLFLCSEIS